VLCSDNKTYQIRQQQTSNSLFIINPRQSVNTDGTVANEISTIASCAHTLELFANKDSVETYFREFLKAWDGEDEEMTIEKLSKAEVYNNVPLSTVEIDTSWKNVYAFEHNGACYIPTIATLLKSWKSIAAAAFAEGLDLMDNGQDGRLWESVSEENIPLDLYRVIMCRARASDGAIWVARLFLESLQGRSIRREDFFSSVQELIPRTMKPSVDLDAVKVCCSRHKLSLADSLGICRSI
jgi:sister chromatid cohesion protein DCC1